MAISSGEQPLFRRGRSAKDNADRPSFQGISSEIVAQDTNRIDHQIHMLLRIPRGFVKR